MGRNLEQDSDLGSMLAIDRQEPIGSRTGRGDNPLCHLQLNHERHIRDGIGKAKHPMDDLGSDVVWKITEQPCIGGDEIQFFEELRKVQIQDIGVNGQSAGKRAQHFPESRQLIRIDFECQEP